MTTRRLIRERHERSEGAYVREAIRRPVVFFIPPTRCRECGQVRRSAIHQAHVRRGRHDPRD